MAVTVANILVKSAVVSMGDYVTAKGAGTLVDVGATLGGASIGMTHTHKRLETDQNLGEVGGVPSKRVMELKFAMIESDIEKFRVAFGQPIANRSGTTPNFTLNVDPNAAEQYHQISFVSKGVGTTKVRTITFWRCAVVGIEPVAFKKDDQQTYTVTIAVFEETTGAGLDNFCKIVDA